jgi:hypothetical protein
MMIPLEPQVGENDCTYYNLESAIASTAEAADGKDGIAGLILQDHLKSLCALQLQRLAEEGKG